MLCGNSPHYKCCIGQLYQYLEMLQRQKLIMCLKTRHSISCRKETDPKHDQNKSTIQVFGFIPHINSYDSNTLSYTTSSTETKQKQSGEQSCIATLKEMWEPFFLPMFVHRKVVAKAPYRGLSHG